jgi:hypothetical protein
MASADARHAQALDQQPAAARIRYQTNLAEGLMAMACAQQW